MDVLDFPCFHHSPQLVGFTPCLAVGSAPPGSPHCECLSEPLPVTDPCEGAGQQQDNVPIQHCLELDPGRDGLISCSQHWLPLSLLVPSTDWGWMHGLGCFLPKSTQTGGSLYISVAGDSPAPNCPHGCLEPSCAPCPGYGSRKTPWIKEMRVFAWWDRLCCPSKGQCQAEGC